MDTMQNAQKHFQDPQFGPCLRLVYLAVVQTQSQLKGDCPVPGCSPWKAAASEASAVTPPPQALGLFPLYERAGDYQ